MYLNSPARLTKPQRRVGERGSGEFEEIEWEEMLDLATAWLARARAANPHRLAFFTGRDQSPALTSWWAMQFGTPDYAAVNGSGNMHRRDRVELYRGLDGSLSP